MTERWMFFPSCDRKCWIRKARWMINQSSYLNNTTDANNAKLTQLASNATFCVNQLLPVF